jgi:phosphotransferase system enzyme I (PtsI)
MGPFDGARAAAQASFTLHGAGVSGGIAIGYAHLFQSARIDVAHYDIPEANVEAEVRRFDAAVEIVRRELDALRNSLAHVMSGAPAEMAAFVGVHRMILGDPSLSQVPRDLVRTRRCNAEWALVQQMDVLVGQFDEIDDPYLRERKNDVVQVVERVLKAMAGSVQGYTPPAHDEDVIVVAHDLSPADMVPFKQRQFAAFVTDVGGITSHTAIVARGLAIPAIVGLHYARGLVRENELLIVDGVEGVLIVNPDKRVLAEYQRRQEKLGLERQKLKRLRTTPARTIDGTLVELQANIELPQDAGEAREVGAAGIGLFRSEFLFLNRRDLPGEEEQFDAYRHVAQAMRGKPVTIRTLDVGSDKSLDSGITGLHQAGPNPALGLRAIRFCLAEPQIFHAQLRAILRASHYGKVRLLIPMIAHTHEVDQTFAALAQARASLDEAGIPYDKSMPVGGMVEIPAAALSLGMLIRKLDFVSIGTNDLIQYTLAIDRADDTVAHLYNPTHPAVLQLIEHTIRTANRARKPVAVCGEMAGDLSLTRLLLGLGLRQFSMHPAQLPAVKQQVLRSTLPDLKPLARKVVRAQHPDKAREWLEALNA